MREDLKDLDKFELIIPAKELLEAVTESADALSRKPIDDERMKSLKLVLGFLNAYLKAYQTKVGYFKLTAIPKGLKSSMKRKFFKFR